MGVSVARRKGMLAVVVLQLVLLAAPLVAQEGVEQFFPAQPTGYLTDVAGVVDPASAARIESIAKHAARKDRRRAGGRHPSHHWPVRSIRCRPRRRAPLGRRCQGRGGRQDPERRGRRASRAKARRTGRQDPARGGRRVAGDPHRRHLRAHSRRHAAAARCRGVRPGARHRGRDRRRAGGAGARRPRLDAGTAQTAVSGGAGPSIFLVLLLVFVFFAIMMADGWFAERGRDSGPTAAGILGPGDRGRRLGWRRRLRRWRWRVSVASAAVAVSAAAGQEGISRWRIPGKRSSHRW